MQKIHDYIICETPGEFLAYREGLGHGYTHAEMMSKAERDRVHQDFMRACELATKATDNGIEACRQRDEAWAEAEAVRCELETELQDYVEENQALAEKLESVMYDRDCLGEELEASQARTLEAVDLGLKVVEELHALENEHERLEKENDFLREKNANCQEYVDLTRAELEGLHAENSRLKKENDSLRAQLSLAQFYLRTANQSIEVLFARNVSQRAQLKKAESALASAGVVITILEATGDNIKKLPG